MKTFFALSLCLPLLAIAGPNKKRALDPKPEPKIEVKLPAKLLQEHATFAGGCFWCMQPPFDKLKGVISTSAGYTGGTKDKPTYEEVSYGSSGHREAIDVVYDPSKISYAELLKTFWKNVDPFDAKGQFCDKGFQYTSAIYFHSPEQKKAAEEAKAQAQKDAKEKGEIATVIEPAKEFFAAEDYHQSYYKKNALKYKFYRFNCGRDKRLEKVWGSSEH